MAVLGQSTGVGSGPRFNSRRRLCLAVLSLVLWATTLTSAETAPSREYQLKAVFLFNFAQFVDWPPRAMTGPGSPLVIGVLGEDPFGSFLDEAVRGEKVNGRPILVQRYRRGEEIGACHVLFISQSETARLAEIIASLNGRAVLTVGEVEEFSRRSGMIRFVMENNKIRLHINVEEAKAADLAISSKLLRPAKIVTAEKG